MLEYGIRNFVSVRTLTASTRLLAIQRLQEVERLTPHDVPELGEALELAVVYEQEVLTMQRERQAREETRRKHDREAPALDQRLDGLLASLNGQLLLQAQAFPPPHATGVHAVRLLDAVFPRGVGWITQKSFAEQHGAVHEVLLVLQDDLALAEALTELGHTALVQEIAIVNEAYGKAVLPAQAVAESQRDAERRGASNLAAIVARIVGRYPSDSDEHLQMRATLLAPVWHLQEEDRRNRKLGARPDPADAPVVEDSASTDPDTMGAAEAPVDATTDDACDPVDMADVTEE